MHAPAGVKLPRNRKIAMRLSPEQAQIIKAATCAVFGPESQVYLFGSRTQDALKGGDIDLYIVPEHQGSLEQRLKLSALLEMQLGEQQIDIILAKDPSRLIEQEALKTGIKL